MSFAKSLGKLAAGVYAALRVVCGLLMATHGAQKFGLVGKLPRPIEAFSQAWIGGWIELVGGLLVAIGLFTVPAAFLVSGTMAVAYIQFHWKLQLGAGLLPLNNGGELALVYSLVFLFIACHGPGAASLDQWRARRR